MATSVDDTDSVTRSPDDVFAAIADETRIRIIRAIGEAEGPLSFSEIRESVGMAHSGQFHYHLDQLVGHLVHKTDDGYELSSAGRYIVEAIYAGVLIDEPPSERIPIEMPCWECGGRIEVRVGTGWVDSYCLDCVGVYPVKDEEEAGRLVRARLPPAGLRNRTPEEAFRVAMVLSRLDMLAYANGICPRCSARVEYTLDVCHAHEDDTDLCETCDRVWGVMVDTDCSNCIFGIRTSIGNILGGKEETLRFWLEHEWNPVDPSVDTDSTWALDEEILSIDPFAGRFTWYLKGDSLVLEVDSDLQIAVVS